MSKRRTPVILAIIGITLVLVVFGGRWFSQVHLPAPGSAAGFNVLIVTLDTTRADHLGCYGFDDAQTPALDGMAARGVLFTDAVTSAPITLPSHASIFTGLDPPNHGVRDNGEFKLEDEQITLAEILSEHGYETAAFTSAFVLDARFGLDQGFEHYDANIGGSRSPAFADNANQRPAGNVTRAAVDWLNAREQDRPFFAWVHYYDPHAPYAPPAAYKDAFGDQLYDGEIAYMDSQIARLLTALDAGGLTENTLVIVVADHGEGLGEHEEATHAMLAYDSVMRVPLIISNPALMKEAHVVDDRVVSVTDIFPTVFELLGIDTAPPGDGISLLSAQTDPDRAIYFESVTGYLDQGWAPLFGLRRHQDKYIQAPRPEFYDLAADPDELDNTHEMVAGSDARARDQLASELAARLDEWPSLSRIATTTDQLDEETLERLQSLGYAGNLRERESEDTLPDPKDMITVMHKVDYADNLNRAGRASEALALIEECAAASPRDRKVHHVMGKIFLKLDREADAEQALITANSFHANVDTSILLAQIRIKQGRLTEALQDLARAEELDPFHGGVHIARGDLLAQQNRPQEALASYQRAIELDPHRLGLAAKQRIAALNYRLNQAP